jgi:hypothetical protein
MLLVDNMGAGGRDIGIRRVVGIKYWRDRPYVQGVAG